MQPKEVQEVSVIPECNMQFSVLGSGSKGNAVYIESDSTAILIDAGFSGKQLESRLKATGKELNKLSAVFLTHEHNDHICGAGILSRRYHVPLFANEGTFRGGAKKLGKIQQRREFETGEKIVFQDLEIRSFRTLHDTLDPVGYVVSNGDFTLGYCTDTGKVTHLMAARLLNCDGLILEFNHDPIMLKNGPYPLALQQRVRSSHGHLANEDAASFLKSLLNDRLQYIILAHLSETNNLPELAHKAASAVSNASDAKIVLARQEEPLPLIEFQKN